MRKALELPEGISGFPARAGVILATIRRFRSFNSFPRVGGDDPTRAILDFLTQEFSPHVRG